MGVNWENCLANTSSYFTYRKLPIDVIPATVESVLREYPYPVVDGEYNYFAHYKLSTDALTEQFSDLLSCSELAVKHAEVFYRPGVGDLYSAFIHTDGHAIVPGLAKINFIIGGASNIMTWYLPKGEVKNHNNMVTKAGTKYLAFASDEVNVIDQCDMSGLYVINAGIPHSVGMVNGSVAAPRICISITPTKLGGSGQVMACNAAYNQLLIGMQIAGFV